MLGALAQAERGGLRRLQYLAGAADELSGDEERQQHVGDAGEFACPHDQVVLVAAVGVACRVGVVLEQVDVAADALVGESLLGVDQQILEYPLARAVVGDQLDQAVAFGRGVLGVAADVEVKACAVAQENVRTAAPRHHPPEKVAGDLVGTQPAMAVEGAGDTEFGLDAHDSSLHVIETTGCWSSTVRKPRRGPIGALRCRHGRAARRDSLAATGIFLLLTICPYGVAARVLGAQPAAWTWRRLHIRESQSASLGPELAVPQDR